MVRGLIYLLVCAAFGLAGYVIGYTEGFVNGRITAPNMERVP